ncbi:MAG: hypothetical protein AAF224_05970 [Pseudomonadota bacterium]
MNSIQASLIDPPTIGRIAMIATATDEVGDSHFRKIIEPTGVSVLTTRTVYTDDEPDENGVFTFRTRFDKVAEAFPDTQRLDILAFGCTSGTVATGRDEILAKLEAARPGLKYTTPGVAALKAFNQFSISSVALLTPYPNYMHSMFIEFFEKYKIAVTADATFNTDENDIGKISPASLLDASKRLISRDKPDALYISCTAINVVPHIDWLEAELGVRIITSTQVMAWDCLSLLGLTTRRPGFGSLFAA